ncbi:hypothetical protein D0T84_10085 [Dysgonomonas sp. 521]|nr:hypothetical protein [Dysgonomonas sp. 521]
MFNYFKESFIINANQGLKNTVTYCPKGLKADNHGQNPWQGLAGKYVSPLSTFSTGFTRSYP